MVIAIASIVGLMLGSFLSVLIGRWPHWRGAATGRSQCPNCQHVLAWYDLLPLVSWLSLRGRCRYCHSPISVFYPMLELTLAVVMGIYVSIVGVPSGWHVADVAVLFGLMALFFFDLKHQMLPDAIVAPLGVIALVRAFGLTPDLLIRTIATGVLLASFFGLLYAISRGRWLGFGDVKLALVLGFLFGFPLAISVTLLSIWAGALVGVVLMALKRASMQTALPFGSFWTAVAAVTMLWPAPAAALSKFFFPLL